MQLAKAFKMIVDKKNLEHVVCGSISKKTIDRNFQNT